MESYVRTGWDRGARLLRCWALAAGRWVYYTHFPSIYYSYIYSYCTSAVRGINYTVRTAVQSIHTYSYQYPIPPRVSSYPHHPPHSKDGRIPRSVCVCVWISLNRIVAFLEERERGCTQCHHRRVVTFGGRLYGLVCRTDAERERERGRRGCRRTSRRIHFRGYLYNRITQKRSSYLISIRQYKRTI